MKIRMLITLFALVAVGCGQSKQKESLKVAEVSMAPPPAKPGAEDKAMEQTEAAPANEQANTTVQDSSKKVIRSGDMRFRTDNLSKTRAAILASLKKLGGYVAEEKEFTEEYNGTRNFTLSTRIPAKNFDKFLNQVSETAAQIDSKNITSSDVTTQYIDMSTRLRNQKALEARYLDLLKKATRMADILEVEAKLNDIRTEIESNQGQLNYLLKQVAYSTLDITFYIKGADFKSGESTNRFSQSLKDGWQLMQQLWFGVITLWPIWIVAILVVYVIRRWRKRNRLNKAGVNQ